MTSCGPTRRRRRWGSSAEERVSHLQMGRLLPSAVGVRIPLSNASIKSCLIRRVGKSESIKTPQRGADFLAGLPGSKSFLWKMVSPITAGVCRWGENRDPRWPPYRHPTPPCSEVPGGESGENTKLQRDGTEISGAPSGDPLASLTFQKADGRPAGCLGARLPPAGGSWLRRNPRSSERWCCGFHRVSQKDTVKS